MEKREHLPSAVKRAVRQRCGFGCVMCGSPVFDYEHIEGYGETGHDAQHMTLLCPGHHREKTVGRMPTSAVRRANENPFNLKKELTSKHPLYFEGSSFDVDLGSLHFESSDKMHRWTAITVDDEAVLSVEFIEGRVSLGLLVRDQDNRPLLVVRGGELRHSATSWDVTFEGSTLVVRRGPGDIVLILKLLPPNRVVVERAELWAQGVLLRIGTSCHEGDGVEIANIRSSFSGFTFKGAKTMLAVGGSPRSEDTIFKTADPPRWLGGMPAEPGTFSRFGGSRTTRFLG